MIRFTPALFLIAVSSVFASTDPRPTCEIRGKNGSHNLTQVYTAKMSLAECEAHARVFAAQPLVDGTRTLHPNNTATITTWVGSYKKIVMLYDSIDGRVRTVWKRNPGAAQITKERVPENFWDCWLNGNCISQ